MPQSSSTRTLRVATASLLLASGALVGTGDDLLAQSGERHTLRGENVAVYNLAGRVRMVATSGRDVEVEVARDGRDGRDLRVAKGTIDVRETLRILYPDDEIVYPALGRGSRTTLNVRRDGTFGGGGGGFFSNDRVDIRGSGSGAEAWADLTIGVPRGQSLALYLAVGSATVTNVDGDLRIDVSSASVSTESTRGRLSVDVGSGGVRVTNAQGDVDLDTGSGSVELTGIRGDRLVVDAGSGGITGRDIDVPTISLDLGSGRTRLSGVRTRDMEVDAGSGGVELELLSDVDRLNLDTGSGTVTLRLPSTLGATLDIETGSGGIDAQIPITVVGRQSRSHLTGRIGDGRGTITIDSGSGGIRLLGR
jgi:lia operon protein LiaG